MHQRVWPAMFGCRLPVARGFVARVLDFGIGRELSRNSVDYRRRPTVRALERLFGAEGSILYFYEYRESRFQARCRDSHCSNRLWKQRINVHSFRPRLWYRGNRTLSSRISVGSRKIVRFKSKNEIHKSWNVHIKVLVQRRFCRLCSMYLQNTTLTDRRTNVST